MKTSRRYYDDFTARSRSFGKHGDYGHGYRIIRIRGGKDENLDVRDGNCSHRRKLELLWQTPPAIRAPVRPSLHCSLSWCIELRWKSTTRFVSSKTVLILVVTGVRPSIVMLSARLWAPGRGWVESSKEIRNVRGTMGICSSSCWLR